MKSTQKIAILFAGLAMIIILGFSQMQPVIQNDNKMEAHNNDLKEYVVLVRLPLNYGPNQAKEVRQEWAILLEQWKAKSIYIVSFVYPNDGYLITGKEKVVTKDAVVSNGFKLASNLIIKAKDYENAIEIAKECPVLDQGGMIEVKEIQPRPNPDR